MIRGTFLNNFGFTKKTNRNMYNTYQTCRGASPIPSGMNLRRFNGKLFAIDPKSPLTARDFIELLSRTVSVRGLTRVASKMGLRFKNSKAETKALVCDALKTRKIAEPVLLGSVTHKMIAASVNNGGVMMNNGGALANNRAPNAVNNGGALAPNSMNNGGALANNRTPNSVNNRVPNSMNNGGAMANNRTPNSVNNRVPNSMNNNGTKSFSNIRPIIQPFTKTAATGNSGANMSNLQARLNKLAEKI